MKVNWVSAVVMIACVGAVATLLALGKTELAALLGVVTPILSSVTPQLVSKEEAKPGSVP